MESNVTIRRRHLETGEEDPETRNGNDKLQYKRQIGLLGGMSLIVGTMIGSGIFISPKGVALEMESVGGSLVIWAAGGVIAMLLGLCYAELGTLIHESGSDYTYLRVGLHPSLAYLFAWQTMIAIKPSSGAIISMTCAEYILTPIFSDDCGKPPDVHIKCLTVVILCIVAWINCYSSKIATRIQIIFTVAKVLALVMIVIGGIVRLAQGHTQNFQNSFDGTTTNPGSVGVALYNCLWSYDAWSSLNYVVEEVKDVKRTLPLAILLGIPLVIVLYVLSNVSYFTVMTVDQLLASPAVAETWARTVISPVSWIIPLAVALSTFGAVNGTMFTAGRLNHAASANGHTIEILSMINIKSFTPVPGILFNTILAIIFAIVGSVLSLINFLSFANWIFNALVMLSLIVLRFTRPHAPRPIKVPIVLPFLALVIAIFLVLAPLIGNPKMEYLYAGLFIIGGFIFYVPFVHFKVQPPFMEPITRCLQLYLRVSPVQHDPEFEDIAEMKINAVDAQRPITES